MSNANHPPSTIKLLSGALKGRTAALASVLSVAMIILGTFSLANGQSTGPEPGTTDPVGAPLSYITLRSDDLMIGKFESGNLNVLDTNEVNEQSVLSTPISEASGGTGVLGLGNSVSASGHILGQDNEQLVNAGRSGASNTLNVRFPLGGSEGLVEFPNLHAPIKNTPDLIAVAVGDLDKIPDEQGVNHDEVVVAYAGPFSGPGYFINLAV